MANMTAVDERVESKSERSIRIFLAVMYFLQVLAMAGLPLMHGQLEDGSYVSISAVNLLIQPDGYAGKADIMLAVYGGILVIFPMVAFFFFLLDKKSKIKYAVSYITCIASAIIICFGPGADLSIGVIISLLLIIVIMFMTTQGFMATKMRQNESVAEK